MFIFYLHFVLMAQAAIICAPVQKEVALTEPTRMDFAVEGDKKPAVEQTDYLVHVLRYGKNPKPPDMDLVPDHPDILPDPRAVRVDPETKQVVIDWQFVPTPIQRHVRTLLDQLSARPTFAERIKLMHQFTNVATRVTDSPYQKEVGAVMAGLGDPTTWPNSYGIDKSDSPINKGKPRDFYRNPEGRKAVGFTLGPDGKPFKREVLAVATDPESGLARLYSYSESKDRDGKVKQEENRSCHNCHCLARATGKILTRVPGVGFVETLPTTRPLSANHSKPTW